MLSPMNSCNCFGTCVMNMYIIYGYGCFDHYNIFLYVAFESDQKILEQPIYSNQ